jgi:excisionase family DNA binding protein
MEKKTKSLNVEELAKFFGVSTQTIWRWCKAGKIPAFKIGSQWKIRQSDLNKIINQKFSETKRKIQKLRHYSNAETILQYFYFLRRG